MQAPSFFMQMMQVRANFFSSIFYSLTGVFGVTLGPGIHEAQLRWTHSYKVGT